MIKNKLYVYNIHNLNRSNHDKSTKLHTNYDNEYLIIFADTIFEPIKHFKLLTKHMLYYIDSNTSLGVVQPLSEKKTRGMLPGRGLRNMPASSWR